MAHVLLTFNLGSVKIIFSSLNKRRNEITKIKKGEPYAGKFMGHVFNCVNNEYINAQ